MTAVLMRHSTYATNAMKQASFKQRRIDRKDWSVIKDLLDSDPAKLRHDSRNELVIVRLVPQSPIITLAPRQQVATFCDQTHVSSTRQLPPHSHQAPTRDCSGMSSATAYGSNPTVATGALQHDFRQRNAHFVAVPKLAALATAPAVHAACGTQPET
jgi:hypothetical protein